HFATHPAMRYNTRINHTAYSGGTTMASAIRLDDHLVQAASTEAALNHRTTPKQIEMWAAIGRAVAQGVSMEDALAVSQGLARVRVERVINKPVATEIGRASCRERVK